MTSGLVLYSDGGGERSGTAGAGCIISNAATGEEMRIVAYLGGATNNEAEICAGLIGFSFLRVAEEHAGLVLGELQWVCDSEYVLKSATEYIHAWRRNGWKTASKGQVKNQGLWRAYLQLSQGIRIRPSHVRGHTGHPQNEACDSAATWARQTGESELDLGGEGRRFEIDASDFSEDWHLIDAREGLSLLREDKPETEALLHFFERLKSIGITGFSGTTREPVDPVEPLLRRLEDVTKLAREHAGKSDRARALSKDLEQILKRHS